MFVLLSLALAAPTLVAGDRPTDELLRAARNSDVAACFQGDASTVVEVDLVVRGSGEVKKAKAKTGSKAMRDCVQDQLRALALSPSDGTAKLHWSLSLGEVSGGLLGALQEQEVATMREGVGGLIGAKGVQLGSGGLGSRGAGIAGEGSATGMGGLGGGGGAPASSGIGGDPIILGSLPRAHMDEVIGRVLPDILACRTEDQQGKVVVKFTVTTDGTVATAQKKTSTLGDSVVEDCVVELIRGLSFDPPPGGGIVIASYPFLFLAE